MFCVKTKILYSVINLRVPRNISEKGKFIFKLTLNSSGFYVQCSIYIARKWSWHQTVSIAMLQLVVLQTVLLLLDRKPKCVVLVVNMEVVSISFYVLEQNLSKFRRQIVRVTFWHKYMTIIIVQNFLSWKLCSL